MTNVGVIFGGRSVEHRVSIESARTVAGALRQAGHEVTPLAIAPDGCWLGREAAAAVLDGETASLAPLGLPVAPTLRQLLSSPAEVLFPIVHGTWGEDGSLQGLCEMVDLPYVGAGVTPSAVAMDKLLSKRLFRAAGLPVVEFESLTRREFERSPQGCRDRLVRLGSPLFVKPRVGGSSVGVERVAEGEELTEAVAAALAFDDEVLVERGVEGRELECSVLGYRRLEASAVGEIVPGNAFYDYADKYLQDTAQLLAPAELAAGMSDRIRSLAVRAFAAVGGWGMARVDFFLAADGSPLVNEVNTLPGFTKISMYPRLWELSGLPLPELVDRLVGIAIERHRDRRRLDAGIKEWLASLGGGPG